MKYSQVIITMVVAICGLLTCDAIPFFSRFMLNRKYKKQIEGSMDLQADPCDNFYQYACGKWEELHQVSCSERNQMVSMTDYEVNRELAEHMNGMRSKGKPEFVKTALSYYKSCINVQTFDYFFYLDWMKLQENLQWPKLWVSISERSNFDWVHALAVMRRYGLNGIFIEEMLIHRRDDNSKTIIDLDKPVEQSGFVSLSYENLQDLMKYLDMPNESTSFDKLWQEVNEFEERLEKLLDIDDNVGKQLITAKELPLPWLNRYMATVLGQITLDPNMELYIQNIPYMEALYDLIKKYDNHFICKYLEIRFLWHLQQNGPRQFNPVDCIQSTRSLMPLAMHWIYKQQHSELEKYTPTVHQLFNNIIGHFNQTLRANNMNFNETILDYLSEKLNTIQLKVGNLPLIDTVQVLESYYKDLCLNATDFYGNHLKVLHFFFKAGHSSNPHTLTSNISQFFNLENYGEGSSSSPYFLPRANIIIVPFTTLRKPLYHPDYEDIYQYSSLGSNLAHEIFHGFDRIGLSVDFKGKMNAWQYRTVLSNPVFVHNYKCLHELYPDVVDEKIADLSGLHYAYGAFFSTHPKALTKTWRIHGTDMSSKKLFFLNYAQLFCDPNISDFEHGQVKDRINDALSHFKEFSKAYGCSRQSRMERVESCQVWR